MPGVWVLRRNGPLNGDRKLMKGAENSFVGVGLYSVPEASRLTGVPSAAVRRWLFGYQAKTKGEKIEHPALWTGQLTGEDQRGVGFLDLLEIRFVAAFRSHGVSLQAIRAASQFARELFNSSHPFTFKRFQTDGKTIFAEIAEREMAEDDKSLLDLVKRQYAFERIMRPSLRGVVYGESGEARAWHPTNSRYVILDPQRSFGRPIEPRSGVPTEVIYSAYKAEDNAKFVARLYGLDLRSVKAAIAFQEKLGQGEIVH